MDTKNVTAFVSKQFMDLCKKYIYKIKGKLMDGQRLFTNITYHL
jgi:hypothetical protein